MKFASWFKICSIVALLVYATRSSIASLPPSAIQNQNRYMVAKAFRNVQDFFPSAAAIKRSQTDPRKRTDAQIQIANLICEKSNLALADLKKTQVLESSQFRIIDQVRSDLESLDCHLAIEKGPSEQEVKRKTKVLLVAHYELLKLLKQSTPEFVRPEKKRR